MFAAPEKPENIGEKTEQEPQNLNKLFANINFIGELYKEQMLASVISILFLTTCSDWIFTPLTTLQ